MCLPSTQALVVPYVDINVTQSYAAVMNSTTGNNSSVSEATFMGLANEHSVATSIPVRSPLTRPVLGVQARRRV